MDFSFARVFFVRVVQKVWDFDGVWCFFRVEFLSHSQVVQVFLSFQRVLHNFTKIQVKVLHIPGFALGEK